MTQKRHKIDQKLLKKYQNDQIITEMTKLTNMATKNDQK